MRLGKPRLARERARAMEDAVLPLINVVFLLMIFFLVAGQMGQRMSASAAPQSWLSEKASAAAPRVLRLLSDGTLDAGGILVTDEGLADEAAGWGGAAVDVQAGPEIPATRVLRVLNVLHAAGIADVRLLTVTPG